MGSVGAKETQRVVVANQVYESENYQLQKVQYKSFARGARGSVGSTTKTGYTIFDSKGIRVEKDNHGYDISAYNYKTQKEAKAVIEALEKQRRK